MTDAIAAIPFSTFTLLHFRTLNTGETRLPECAKLLRVFRLTHLNNKIYEGIVTDFTNLVFNFTSLIFILIVIAHWMCCLFYGIGMQEQKHGRLSWIMAEGLADASVEEQYINSLYWAITTMTTVGYGDIAPVNSSEKIIVMMCMVVACLTFSYILGTISKSIQRFSMKYEE